MNSVEMLASAAKKASQTLALAGTKKRTDAVAAIADAIECCSAEILAANAQDVAAARENGISETLIDRLSLNEKRIRSMAAAAREVCAQEDPVGKKDGGGVRPNGLNITRIRVPLGVVGMIYEARPNVTVDAAALCIRSGNACVLRGGKEAIRSNIAEVSAMRAALESVGLPADCITLVEDTTRQSSLDMMRANGLIDVLIPRGGAGLIQAVVQNSRVPVIETGVGNCNIYVDASADIGMAVEIAVNAKCSRPSVCNAAESFLVHEKAAVEFLKRVAPRLAEYNVEIVGCERTREILGDTVAPATEEDYATEFLGYKVSIRVVESLEQAMEHIGRFGTHHSECIVTEDYSAAKLFTERVDAAAVYVNASTRFTDGGEFGLGAEIGISTQKLHTRGPMGLADLTTVKYIILGEGQTR